VILGWFPAELLSLLSLRKILGLLAAFKSRKSD
jgi:hypothetical protein